MIKPYIFYDFLKLLIKGIPKPVGVSIDITNRCNLKCKHCYFWRQNYQAELDDNAWLNKIKDLIFVKNPLLKIFLPIFTKKRGFLRII